MSYSLRVAQPVPVRGGGLPKANSFYLRQEVGQNSNSHLKRTHAMRMGSGSASG